AFTEFLIYFTSSLGLNIFIQTSFTNSYYFSGGINLIYKQFNNLIQFLLILLAVVIVIIVTTTLVLSKKRDIAIMKSLGTIPRKLYNFYLLEVYILFLIGFLGGMGIGFIIFIIFASILGLFNFLITFQIDLVYTPILFFSCIVGIFIITGFVLRKIGKQKIVYSFSKDIPYNYNAKKPIKFIPKWLSSIGFNIKIAIVNTLRKKGEFQRYLILFSLIGLLIFTLGLGTIILNLSSREWIFRSQDENIIILGHKDVVYNYSLMYKMFSDPSLIISENDINFTNPSYLFNLSDISELYNNIGIEKIDERLINFCDVKEISSYHITEDGRYIPIGQNREANIPVIGVNSKNIIQNFEIEGKFLNEEDNEDNVTIGDGLAYNFFDYALDQELLLTEFDRRFDISGVMIDSFFSGYAVYMSINETRKLLSLSTETVNIIMLKIKLSAYNEVLEELSNITNDIGENFTFLKLDQVFNQNLDFLNILSMYPTFLVVLISLIAILSLYNYQKSGIMEKAKDFLIMRAIGSKTRSLKKILFMESLFVLIPSLVFSLALGMIVNSLFFLNHVYLPPLYIPFILFFFLFIAFVIFNFFSLFPIIKKFNNFTIKDFDIY
ncbi:MAG: FtsX-like permease family protein, partial [Candidatus Thorarchaeota archaeon]